MRLFAPLGFSNPYPTLSDVGDVGVAGVAGVDGVPV